MIRIVYVSPRSTFGSFVGTDVRCHDCTGKELGFHSNYGSVDVVNHLIANGFSIGPVHIMPAAILQVEWIEK
jgi:hypothetical protein